MTKSWATKRWMLAAAAAFGLVGLVLKVSEISRPGRSTAPVSKRAALPPVRSTERREARGPAVRDPADWRSDAAPTEPDAAASEDGDVRRPLDTTGGLPQRLPGRRAADGGLPEAGESEHRLGVRSHRAGGVPQNGGRLRHRGELQTAVVGGSGDAAPTAGVAGGRTMNELRAPQAVAGQTTPTVPATADTVPANTDVAFDSGNATSYGTESQVEVPDVPRIAGQSGTLSFWLQPQWDEGNRDDATLVQLGDSRLQVIKNVNFLRFEFTDDNGVTGGIGAPIADWKAGESHQITTTWNGSQFSLYFDGQLVSQTVHDGRVTLARDTKLFIGSDFPESRPVASGTIGGLELHNQQWSLNQVANQYQSAVGGKNTPGASPGGASQR